MATWSTYKHICGSDLSHLILFTKRSIHLYQALPIFTTLLLKWYYCQR